MATGALRPLAPSEDELAYELAGGTVHERVAVTAALFDLGISYRWEPGHVLAVPNTAGEQVDSLLEGLREGAVGVADGDAEVDETEADLGWLDEDEEDVADGGEEAQAAMEQLFLAADRLQGAPDDVRWTADFLDAADTVVQSLPPYGVDRSAWARLQGLASAVVADLDADGEEDVVAAAARGVRDFLRNYV